VFRRWLVVVVGVALVCAGCGSGDASRPLATAVVGPILAVASSASVDASAQSASASARACILSDASANMPNSSKVYFGVELECPSSQVSGRVFATMASTLVPEGSVHGSPGAPEANTFVVDPCSLPGRSDLPGAKLTWTVDMYSPGPATTYTFHYTLPADKDPPVLSAGSTPTHGTPVHAGETILVHITATEPAPTGPQEGIREIQLAGPGGEIAKAGYGVRPIACDKSRLAKTLTTHYTVPQNPPAVITLTAHSTDFAGNTATPLSASFPTGNVWTGTAHITAHNTYNNGACPATLVDDDTISLTVAANGTVQGTVTHKITATSCGPARHETYSLPLLGQLTGGAFHFTNPGLYFPKVVPLGSSKTMAALQFHGGPLIESTEGGSSSTTWAGTINLTQTSSN